MTSNTLLKIVKILNKLHKIKKIYTKIAQYNFRVKLIQRYTLHNRFVRGYQVLV